MTPTNRTLNLLRKTCSFVEITERWNPFAKRRNDLFGFCDVLAIGGNLTVAVQVTTSANVSARFEKMQYLPSVIDWLRAPTRKVYIHGWSKKGAAGKRKLWTCRIIELALNETGALKMCGEHLDNAGEP